MKTLKYAVAFVLLLMALGIVASDIGAGLDKTIAIAGSSQTGISVLAQKAVNPNHDRCVASCAATFPDKYSFQYKACIKGC